MESRSCELRKDQDGFSLQAEKVRLMRRWFGQAGESMRERAIGCAAVGAYKNGHVRRKLEISNELAERQQWIMVLCSCRLT